MHVRGRAAVVISRFHRGDRDSGRGLRQVGCPQRVHAPSIGDDVHKTLVIGDDLARSDAVQRCLCDQAAELTCPPDLRPTV